MSRPACQLIELQLLELDLARLFALADRAPTVAVFMRDRETHGEREEERERDSVSERGKVVDGGTSEIRAGSLVCCVLESALEQ